MFKKLKKYLTMFTVLSLIIPSFLLNLINVDKAFATTNTVIINELMVNSTQEWIELYNSSDTTEVDVTGWYFSSIDYAGSLYTISAPTTITPNGFLKLDLAGSKLRNDVDDVTLLDSTSNTLDQITYGSNPWTQIVAAPSVNKTIGRVDDGSSCWFSNLAASPRTSNQLTNLNLPVSINSANIKATGNNPVNFINNATKSAATMETELTSYQDSTLTAYLNDNDGNVVSKSITAQTDLTLQEISGINASSLIDGAIVPWLKITDTATGISTEYLEGTSGQKDIIAPNIPTAAQVKATANNADNYINSYSKTNVTVSVTLPAPLLASDTVNVDLSDGVSVDKNITGQTTNSVLISGIDASSLDEGNVTINAEVIDQAGNPSGWFTGTAATKDTVGPTSTITLLDNSYGPLTWLDRVDGTASDTTSGIDGIAASVQRNSDSKYFNGTDWQATEYLLSTTYLSGSWSFNLSSSLLEHGVNYTVKSYAVDIAGNTQTLATTKIFTYDTSVPSGTFTINDGAVYTTTNNVTLKMTASADATKMQFSNDDLTWSSWENLAATKSWTLSTGDGNKTVYARFKNAAGNESAKVTNIITFDTNAPTGTLSVNSSATYTNSKNVTLSIAGTDITSGMDKMQFSNDNITWSDWEAYNTSKSWTLTDNDGTKTVYAKLKDKAGNITTATISDGIILDSTLPTVSAGTDQTKNAQFTQTGSASDANGIASYAWSKVSGPGTIAFGSSTAISTTTSASIDGTYVIRLTTTDNAGNSASDDFTLIWDTTLPTGTIAINNGANYTKSTSVTLNLSTTDTSGVQLMAFSNNGVDFTAWENYAATKAYTLPTGDGDKTVYAKFMDNAGNIGLIISDSIILDTTVPSDPKIIDSPNGQTITKGSEIKLSGTSEPDATLTIKIYSDAQFTDFINANSSGNWSYTFSSATLDKLAAGDHKITLSVTDQAGNVSNELAIANFTLNDQVAATQSVSQPTSTDQEQSDQNITSPSDESDGTEITTIGPENGEAKGEETNSNKTTKTLVTLGILIIAIGAVSGGYYGYQWWMGKEAGTKTKTSNKKKSKKEEKFGRW